MVTIRDVAKESGYSSALISRLFKGDETLAITPSTKNKIITTALALGYDRSKIKTSLHTIAVLFWLSEEQIMEDAYFKNLKDGLEKYSKTANMDLVFISKEEGIEKIPDDVSGFIAIGPVSREELLILHRRGMKGVVRGINPLPKLFDTVDTNIRELTREAIDYFLNEGIQKIGLIGGKFLNPDSGKFEMDSRERAFREHLANKGLLEEKYIFTQGEFTIETGIEMARKMVDTLGKDLPEACFIASDTIAVGVLQGFTEKGILLPKRMSLISVNDHEMAKYVSVPLTTFHINTEEMAKSTIDLLSDQLVYPRDITKSILLGANLTIRKSFVPTKPFY